MGLLLGHNLWLNHPLPLRPNFNSALMEGRDVSKTTALLAGEILLEKMGEIEVFPGVVSSEGIYQRLAEKEETRLLLTRMNSGA